MKRSAIVQSSAIAIALGLVSAALVHAPSATAYGPGGWDRLGHGATATSPALNGDVLAMSTDLPGQLVVGGKFTDAGGIAAADRIASWNGTAWSSIGPASTFNGDIFALAIAGGKIYAGGTFTNAGGDADADFLAVWDGVSWLPFCAPPANPLNGNVKALEVVGSNLYVGGEFQDGGGIATADYMLRCDLSSGAPSSTIVDPVHPFAGSVYALTSDSSGNLYAGGTFSNLENNAASDYVAVLPPAGVWTNLGPDGSVTGFVRSLTSDGTDLFIGSDGVNIGGLPKADHVARWNGSAWSAMGANTAGTNGYLPSTAGTIDALHASGGHVYVTGNWYDANGDPKSDYIADFDGSAWHPIGSNGAGNGPLNAKGEALAIFGGVLHVGGNFTSAGGDSLARFLARYDPQPSNTIKIPKVVFNKDKGTATLSVQLPGPGQLVAVGKGFKKVGRVGVERGAKPVSGGTVKLKIKPNRATKEKLRDKGKAKVKVKIKFTPTGGTTSVTTKKIKLKLND